MHTWPAPIRALRHPNFRLYFFGHAISTLGTWVQQVALAWLIYRLTDSAALLGATAFIALIPQLLIGPLAGAWIDRHDKRRLLILVESLLALQALVLMLLTALELLTPALILGMTALLGVLNAVDTPLRQSLLGRFIDDRKDLSNALALNASLVTSSRFVGPPVAGLLLLFFSEAVCFGLNAVSYLALVIGLLLVRLQPSPIASGTLRSVFGEGVRHIWQQHEVRRLMISVLAVNFTASSYVVLLPVFARDVFLGDATTLGWLWGAAGLGSLASTLLLASLKSTARLARLLLLSALIASLTLILFALSTNLWLALAAIGLVGFGISCNNVGTNILLQEGADESLRGRIVAIYTSIRFGSEAIGGLLAGALAALFGAPLVLLVYGLVLLGFCFWLRLTGNEQATDDSVA